MAPDRQFLLLLKDINRNLDAGVSLASVAKWAGRSRFELHRRFQRITGETLKHYTLRLKLERAAASLIATDESVLTIALTNGFASHEVFTRAFRRQFGGSPTTYRDRAASFGTKAQRLRHLTLTKSIGPCVRFFHAPTYKNFHPRPKAMPVISITRKEVAAQPILFIQRRIAPSEMQATLGECFGKLFGHGAKSGLPIAGWPLCRYVSTGQGLWTIEPAMPLAAPAATEGEMQAGSLYSGPVAFGIHAGPYENLPDTNAAIERWIEASGYKVAGAPWEQYVTDPGEHPDPKDWRTEVYWPIEK